MILAVDLGSTFFKTAVFDDELSLRGSGASRLLYRYASGGRVEFDVNDAVAALRNAATEACDTSGVEVQALRAVALTSQAQTFTVVDGSGRAKIPFISWQDTRAEKTCEQLAKRSELADFDRHASFGELIPALQICQLAYLQRTRPDLLATDHRILPLPTFFLLQCTAEALLDHNLAAMSGLYSLQTSGWWPAALATCGLSAEQLPKLVATGSVVAHTTPQAESLGLPSATPVVLAGNDQTAGAFAAGLHDNASLLLTLGTAHVAYVCDRELPRPRTAVCRGPYPGAGYYRLTVDGCGGNIVNWARTVLPECSDDEAFFALAAGATRGCQGLCFDADLPASSGAWHNIGTHHTGADFARSVIESLSKRVADLVRQLDVDPSGTPILIAGGGSRQPLWLQILADTLGAPLTLTEADPLRGAALMARRALAGA